jgi:drug/metabolite transporter (DMT)-like permease
MLKKIKRRMLIMTAAAYFCLALLAVLLVEFVRLGGLPSSLIEWVVVIGIAVVATAVITAFSYFAWWYVVDRFFLAHRQEDPPCRQQPDPSDNK